MTTPGVPTSPAIPPMEGPARDALRAAQARMQAFTHRPPFLPMPREQREEALKDAKATVCGFCAAWHEGASTAACPRISKVRFANDGKTIIEVEFWPHEMTTSAIETDGEGKPRVITHHQTSGWDTGRAVRVQDAAEDEPEGEGDGAHPG